MERGNRVGEGLGKIGQWNHVLGKHEREDGNWRGTEHLWDLTETQNGGGSRESMKAPLAHTHSSKRYGALSGHLL